MKNPEFAKQFKALMKSAGLNGKKTAELCGIPESAVSQYASGRVTPSDEAVAKIQTAFNAAYPATTAVQAPQAVFLSDYTNVPVSTAARLLGLSERLLRNGLKSGAFPFGFAQRRRLRWRFHISPNKLFEYLGENRDEIIQRKKNGIRAKRLKIAECAAILGIGMQFLRGLIRKGTATFAVEIRGQKRVKSRFRGKTTTTYEDNARCSYYIHPQKFYDYAGLRATA